MDPGTDGSAAYAYVLGRDSIILSEACPYGGAYIAGASVENNGGWTGEVYIFRLYDANGDIDILQDELVCLGRKPLSSDVTVMLCRDCPAMHGKSSYERMYSKKRGIEKWWKPKR